MRARAAVVSVVAAFLVLDARVATAIDLDHVLVDYALTSWTQKDGLPSPTVWAIAESRDGYLWLGTDAGLVRFDGTRFTPWRGESLPARPVRALTVARDGALWVGFGDAGGVARLDGRAVRIYGGDDGLPPSPISAIYLDPAGVIWAGTGTGFYRFEGARWERIDQIAAVAIQSIVATRRGDLLVATDAGAYRRPHDSGTFVALGSEAVRGIVEDDSGQLWVTDPFAGFARFGVQPRVPPREQGRGNRLLVDATGNLWVGTSRQGLWRVRPDGTASPRAEKTTALVGFSDDGVVSVFQDSHGNIWAGTLDGLNRLTRHALTPITSLGLVTGLDATADGGVWVASADTVIRFRGANIAQRDPPRRLPAVVTTMHADVRGRLWIAAGDRLFHIDAPEAPPVPLAGLPPLHVVALTSDRQGGLWIADDAGRLLRWVGSRMQTIALDDVGDVRWVSLARDGEGTIWGTAADGRVVSVTPPGSVRSYAADRLQIGTPRVIYEDHRGRLWFAGTQGLARYDHGRWATLRSEGRFPSESVVALVEDGSGAMWVGTEGAGVLRIDGDELDRAMRDPGWAPRYRLFDKFDGFAGTARWFGAPTAVRAAGGTLWFIGGRGVTVVDPATLQTGPPPGLPARIERVLADDSVIDAGSAATLPARTSRIQIEYSVLDLTASLRSRFRYRLVGFDSEWVDAGYQRQALYTNLPPGRYEFHVVARGDDGTWSDAAGQWSFVVPPRFYQTTWFAALCVCGAALIIAGGWRLHVRRVRRQFEVLLGERARLSRELHDTLLQGLYGVALRCEAMTRQATSADTWLRDQCLAIRRDVQGYIHDARQAIQDLRSPRLERGDLAAALREAMTRATAGTGIHVDLAVTGGPQPCRPDVEQQLLRIGQEAVLNTVRHADASAVAVDLHYTTDAVSLRVRDDGCGFDPDGIGRPDGHYGLASMRERAASIGGTLRVVSGRGRGAEVEAVVPR